MQSASSKVRTTPTLCYGVQITTKVRVGYKGRRSDVRLGDWSPEQFSLRMCLDARTGVQGSVFQKVMSVSHVDHGVIFVTDTSCRHARLGRANHPTRYIKQTAWAETSCASPFRTGYAQFSDIFCTNCKRKLSADKQLCTNYTCNHRSKLEVQAID